MACACAIFAGESFCCGTCCCLDACLTGEPRTEAMDARFDMLRGAGRGEACCCCVGADVGCIAVEAWACCCSLETAFATERTGEPGSCIRLGGAADAVGAFTSLAGVGDGRAGDFAGRGGEV